MREDGWRSADGRDVDRIGVPTSVPHGGVLEPGGRTGRSGRGRDRCRATACAAQVSEVLADGHGSSGTVLLLLHDHAVLAGA